MNNPILLSPHWDDYELIDSGNFEKLERWGRQITVRPEPQAIWQCSLSEEEWQRSATAIFRRDNGSDERGRWQLKSGTPEQWYVDYRSGAIGIRMRLGFTAFKHVGLFPEQAENWNYIAQTVDRLRKAGIERPKVLNLFAYTGGATLAAACAGAEVTHIDSVKQVVGWARANMEASKMEGVRWIVDDALKFVRRECKRGNRYHGIVLDPPAYGRGPEGEKWVLEQNIGELLECCQRLLEPDNSFLVLNLYSMGLSAMLARSAVNQMFGTAADEQFGELYFTDRFDKSLPLGVFYRFRR